MLSKEDWVPSAKQIGGLAAAGVLGGLIAIAARRNDIQWSAWVSAIAAVIQAIAAAIAIWYTGKLARESAQREKEADAAALRRAEAAEAESIRRADVAEEKAALRGAAAEAARYDEPLLGLIYAGENAQEKLFNRIELLAANNPDENVWPNWPDEVSLLMDTITPLREHLRDPVALAAAAKMAQATLFREVAMFPRRQIIDVFTERMKVFEDATDELRACLRGQVDQISK